MKLVTKENNTLHFRSLHIFEITLFISTRSFSQHTGYSQEIKKLQKLGKDSFIKKTAQMVTNEMSATINPQPFFKNIRNATIIKKKNGF